MHGLSANKNPNFPDQSRLCASNMQRILGPEFLGWGLILANAVKTAFPNAPDDLEFLPFRYAPGRKHCPNSFSPDNHKAIKIITPPTHPQAFRGGKVGGVVYQLARTVWAWFSPSPFPFPYGIPQQCHRCCQGWCQYRPTIPERRSSLRI
jgi:hypothetical protein